MGLAGVLLGLALLIWQAFRGESALLLHLHLCINGLALKNAPFSGDDWGVRRC
jgi:hypothetical protein